MNTLRSMFGYIRRHPFLWLFGLLVPSLAALGTNLAFAYGLQAYTAELTGADATMHNVVVIMLVTLVALVITSLLEDGARYVMAVFIMHTENAIRQGLMECLLRARYLLLTPLDRGELSTRYLNDAGVAAGLITWDLHSLLWPIVLGVGYLAALYGANALIATVMFALAAIVIVLNLAFAKRFTALEGATLRAQDGFAGIVNSAIRGRMNVRLLSAGGRIAARATDASEAIFAVEEGKNRLTAARALSAEFFATVCGSLTAPLAAILAAYGWMPVASVVLVAQLCRYLVLYTGGFGAALTSFKIHAVSRGRLTAIQELEQEARPEQADALPAGEQDVLLRCRDVSIGYGGQAVISGLNLTVKRGEIVALLGASGSGKSTIVKALLRLIGHQGNIELLGREIDGLPLDGLRRTIAYVPEHGELFDGTVGENLRHAAPEADEAQLTKVLCAAALDDATLPERQVGAKGAWLSGGERQRVAIARALLKDAPLIIMDEPTASLDAQSEAHLLHTLDALKRQGKGLLIITHRKATASIADTVVTL